MTEPWLPASLAGGVRALIRAGALWLYEALCITDRFTAARLLLCIQMSVPMPCFLCLDSLVFAVGTVQFCAALILFLEHAGIARPGRDFVTLCDDMPWRHTVVTYRGYIPWLHTELSA